MAVCNLVLAATFLVSGFVKAVDPIGMAYKLDAYLVPIFSHSVADNGPLLPICSIALATVEFLLGVHFLLGNKRRLTSWFAVAFMLLLTLLTLYVYAFSTVTDCGCFGAAFSMSNGATLAKNVVLLLLVSISTLLRSYQRNLISDHTKWVMTLFSLFYIIGIGLHSLHSLPPIDFTDFREGTNLRKAYNDPDASTPIGLINFSCTDKEGEIMTDSLLARRSKTFLLTLPSVGHADDGCNDRINDIVDLCRDSAFAFYALVPYETDPKDIVSWIDRTGATYPILFADADQLRGMVRSNPGLMLLDDGLIVKKWSNNNLPDVAADGIQAQLQTAASSRSNVLRLLLWIVVPLLLCFCADRLWLLRKKRQSKKAAANAEAYTYYETQSETQSTNINQNIMRKKIVAGNWKMNKNLQEGVALATELNNILTADKPNCDVVICTPFIHLASVAGVIDQNIIGLGAENCADKVSGAYTGEVSAEMVKSTGAQYVILGHSERRAYYHETAEILKEKVNLALANGLKVIFCIGEVLDEREAGKQNEVVKAQLEGSLFDLTKEELSNVILAYEPVWAIGTGKTATADQAEDMHAFIRSVIAEKFGAEAAENISILYGGSCKPTNAKEIFAKPDVDGGLIGGAALKAPDFKGIIDAWK